MVLIHKKTAKLVTLEELTDGGLFLLDEGDGRHFYCPWDDRLEYEVLGWL